MSVVVELFFPSVYYLQTLALCRIGTNWFRFCPDPGATTSWIRSSSCPQEVPPEGSSSAEFFKALQGEAIPDWLPPLTGYSEADQSSSFQPIPEDAPDIIHDGFQGTASWILEQCVLQDAAGTGSIGIHLKLRVIQKLKSPFNLICDGLIGLGISKKHHVNSNWLLSAVKEGMDPVFAFRCGLAYPGKPTLCFGGGLVEMNKFKKRGYQSFEYPEDVHSSQWYLRLKAILWKCKNEEESIIDKNNLSYAQKWKNTSPDKIFSSRSFSWGWFDMGYGSITFPKTLGNSDSEQIIKFMKDIKAGNLAVKAGELAPPLISSEVKVEYVSFVFDNEREEDGVTPKDDNYKWTFNVEDMVSLETGKRFWEMEFDSLSDRKCIIFGLPFAKKYSIEYNFDHLLLKLKYKQTIE
eukprot:TRINITY_DN17278_c0_g1_i12.p1 TRINITY_DN17278_c0_g1~~TRINITY_DN17278_c0_g1_i12.p1  ORF type:complete len:407 (-),score=97.71 TRINITY_DN17278_c0_g1_i12:115-1335(-)